MAQGLRRVALALSRGLAIALLGAIFASPASQAGVGRTPGDFSTSANGTAGYSIPIWVPPGTHGVEPQIALAYDSAAGNGYLGHGWSLSGVSGISRCVRTFAQDGSPNPIDLTNNDGYCLNGKRLILVSGTYGADASTYEPEIRDFSEVKVHVPGSTGPAYFTVQARDGLLYEYGNGSNSQVLATGSSVATSWMLDKIYDRRGNTLLTVSYKAPSADLSGATVPDTISWAPTSAGSASFQNTVQFNYISNVPQSSLYGYVAATLVQNSALLSSIVVSGSGSVVRKYALTYVASPTTGANRLTQVQECADLAGSNCLAASVISYQNGAAGVSSTGTTITGGDFEATLDLNGDGFKDLIYQPPSGPWYIAWGSSAGFGTAFSTGISGTLGRSIAFGNLNGAEKAGIVAPNGSTWWYYTWNGSSFSGVNTGATYNSAAQFAGLQDVNGDGLPDLISGTIAGPTNNKTYSVLTQLNTASGGVVGFSGGSTANFSTGDFGNFVTADLSIPRMPDSGPNTLLDFNGDGRGDLVLSTRELLSFGCSPPSPCTTKQGVYPLVSLASGGYNRGSLGTLPLTTSYYVLNWNNDACADTVVSGTGPAAGVHIAACNGNSSQNINATNTMLGSLDWDGDGRTDVIVVNGSTIGVRLSTGNGIGSVVATSIPYSASTCASVKAIDANGDGLPDLVCVGTSSFTVYLHNGVGTPPDLASSFADGFGVTATPTYVPLNQATYTADTATYPSKSYRGSAYVVDHYLATDGTGTSATYRTNLAYAGAWADLQGRGFQGFDSIQTTDTRTYGLVQLLNYKRDFPWTGMINQEHVYQSGGTTLIRSAARLQAASNVTFGTAPNLRYFPHFGHEGDVFQEVGGPKNGLQISSKNINYTYDPWGNATQVHTTTYDDDVSSPFHGMSWDEIVSQTVVAYTTGGQWCIYQPTQQLITRTTPDLGGSTLTRTTNYTVDASLCHPTQKVVEPGNATYAVTTDWLYDSFDNISSETETGVGMTARTTLTDWGTNGQFPVWVKNPLNEKTSYGYDYRFGMMTSQTSPNTGANTTSWTPDAFGRIVREDRPDGTYLTSTPALAGIGIDPRVIYTIENDSFASGGALIRQDYGYFDRFDRNLDAYHPVPIGSAYAVQTRGYNEFGRVSWEGMPFVSGSLSAYTPAYQTSYVYDPLGRVTLTSRPTSQLVSTPVNTLVSYAGGDQTVTDALSKTSTTFTNVAGLLAKTTDHAGYAQNLRYDPFGNIKSVVDSLGNTLFTASYQYGIDAFQVGATDADLGAKTFVYDALGEMTGATDAMSQVFTYTYDPLSRPKTRVEPGLTTTWDWGATGAANNIGHLADVYTSTGYAEYYTYDNYSRLIDQKITIPSDQDYYLDYTYNLAGDPDTLQFPVSTSSTRVQLQYGYLKGELAQVTDFTGGTTGTVYWQATDVGPWGQVSKEALGNGAFNTTRSLDAVTGWTSGIQSGIGASTTLQNQAFLYDAVGNVTQRQEVNLGQTETFYYDDLHRLEHSTLKTGIGSPVTNLVMTYCPTVANPTCPSGNIDSKSTVASGATWTYDPAQKHAVKTAGSGNSFGYDANGNMTSRTIASVAGTIGWTSYNYPNSISTGAETATFAYGPDRQYYQQNYTAPGVAETTRYVGGVLEKVSNGSTVDWRHHVNVGDHTVAVISRKSTSPTPTVAYVLEDQQNSPTHLVDGAGTGIVWESFDAFGQSRDGSAWSGPVSAGDESVISGISRRGYTTHSMLGTMGLIHMNGRVEDGLLGRFLSPDVKVPSPTNTQSYNRYSYAHNNPLSYVDPDGFDEQPDEVLDEVTVTATPDRDRNIEFSRLEVLPEVAVIGIRDVKELPPCAKDGKRDATKDEAAAVLDAARKYIGTHYPSTDMNHDQLKQSLDCGQLVAKGISDVDPGVGRLTTSNLSSSSSVRKLSASDEHQLGDVMFFGGHMGLYDTNGPVVADRHVPGGKVQSDVLSAMGHLDKNNQPDRTTAQNQGVKDGYHAWFEGPKTGTTWMRVRVPCR